MNIKYIEVDATHIIEVSEGLYFPRRLVNAQLRDHLEGWGLYRSGRQPKCFKTEQGARTFLATADQERRYLVSGYAR